MIVRFEPTDRALTAYGGAELLRQTARAVGLGEHVDACVGVKLRARGLSEGQFVTGVAEAIGLGASCLDDLAVARADAAQETLRGFGLPAPQTAGAWLRRFTLGHIRQLNKALEATQRRAFALAGVTQVTLDFDSTYLFSRSKRREGVDRTYKKGYALHPLLCFDAASGAAVHARLRRGKVFTANGMATFLTETLRRVPAGVAVRARFDSGFYGDPLLTQMETAGVTYLCGAPFNPRLIEAIRTIGEDSWRPCVDKDEGEVAEFGYRLADKKKFRRYIVKRIAIEDGEQASLDQGAWRHWVFVTNDHTSTPAELESEHRHKADVEHGMRELKSNFGLGTIRKHGFMANWVWLLLVCAGHNLCCWAQQLGQLHAARGGGLRAKRFRYRYLTVAAMLVHSGRQLTLRVPAAWPDRRRFETALTRIRTLATAPG